MTKKLLLMTRHDFGCPLLREVEFDGDECTCTNPETTVMTQDEWHERLGAFDNDGTEYENVIVAPLPDADSKQ